MICDPKYNEACDIQRTRFGLGIDLSRALREGIVTDSGTEPEYNNIDDPGLIRGRVSDVFTAIDERNAALNKAAAPRPSAKTPSDESQQ